jgi:hypothetical protein
MKVGSVGGLSKGAVQEEGWRAEGKDDERTADAGGEAGEGHELNPRGG